MLGEGRRGFAAWLIYAGLAIAAYGWLWPEAPLVVEDSVGYLQIAGDLGDGWLGDVHFWPPGYPLLLRATGSWPEPRRLLLFGQLLLYFCAAGAVLAQLRAFGVGRVPVAVSGALLAAPHLVQPAAFVLSEGLAGPILVLGATLLAGYLFVHGGAWRLALASALLGALPLVRVAFQLLPPGLALLLLGMSWAPPCGPHRPRLRRAAAGLVAGWAILSGGYALHNQIRFGHAAASLTGYQLTTRTASFVEVLPDEYADLRELLVRHRDRELLEDRHHRPDNYVNRARPDLLRRHGGDLKAASDELLRANLWLIRHEPRNYFREVLHAAGRFWEPYSEAVPGLGSGIAALLAAGAHLATIGVFWLSLAFCLGWLVWSWLAPPGVREIVGPSLARHGPALGTVALCGAIVIYTMAVSVLLGTGHPRYRAVTDPLIVQGAVLATTAWLRFARNPGGGIERAGSKALR